MVPFGPLEGEVIIDHVGMIMLVNHTRLLIRSKIKVEFLQEVIERLKSELRTLASLESSKTESLEVSVKKPMLLMSAVICLFDILHENQIITSNPEDKLDDLYLSLIQVSQQSNVCLSV